MNFIVNGYNVFIIILTTFLTSLILTHLMIKISKKWTYQTKEVFTKNQLHY